MKRIGAYGTLKKDFWNHHYIGKGAFVGEYKINGSMFMVSSYPVLFIGGEQRTYTLEVYDVNDIDFHRIQRLEQGYTQTVYETDDFGDVIIFVGNELFDRYNTPERLLESFDEAGIKAYEKLAA